MLQALARAAEVEQAIGLARRVPRSDFAKTTWLSADVRHAELESLFEGADVVIHLAWLIQPSRDEVLTRSVNVEGSARVFAAVARAGVPALVYASSVGAYSPGPVDRTVDESWPTEGIETSFYSRHKAEVERLLDRFEVEHPQVRAVRLRPALIFKRDAASEIRRLFIGPLLPSRLLRREWIPLLPFPRGLRTQAVHSSDVGEAYRLAATQHVAGAFNIAADPSLDADTLARVLHARIVGLPARALRLGADASWRLRLQPTSPGWLDMGMLTPLMDTSRARKELGWKPAFSSEQALLELLEGLRESAGMKTPPLDRRTSGPLRVRDFLTGVGASDR